MHDKLLLVLWYQDCHVFVVVCVFTYMSDWVRDVIWWLMVFINASLQMSKFSRLKTKFFGKPGWCKQIFILLPITNILFGKASHWKHFLFNGVAAPAYVLFDLITKTLLSMKYPHKRYTPVCKCVKQTVHYFMWIHLFRKFIDVDYVTYNIFPVFRVVRVRLTIPLLYLLL